MRPSCCMPMPTLPSSKPPGGIYHTNEQMKRIRRQISQPGRPSHLTSPLHAAGHDPREHLRFRCSLVADHCLGVRALIESSVGMQRRARHLAGVVVRSRQVVPHQKRVGPVRTFVWKCVKNVPDNETSPLAAFGRLGYVRHLHWMCRKRKEKRKEKEKEKETAVPVRKIIRCLSAKVVRFKLAMSPCPKLTQGKGLLFPPVRNSPMAILRPGNPRRCSRALALSARSSPNPNLTFGRKIALRRRPPALLPSVKARRLRHRPRRSLVRSVTIPSQTAHAARRRLTRKQSY